MNNNLNSFGNTAKALAKNPLGIIALFIVLVYGIAALVTTFSGSISICERLPLIWFLVIFPVLVLIVFTWLVSKHSGKLFAPSDFKDEDNYIRMQSNSLPQFAYDNNKSLIAENETELQGIFDKDNTDATFNQEQVERNLALYYYIALTNSWAQLELPPISKYDENKDFSELVKKVVDMSYKDFFIMKDHIDTIPPDVLNECSNTHLLNEIDELWSSYIKDSTEVFVMNAKNNE